LLSSSFWPRAKLTTFCLIFLAFAAKAEDQTCTTAALGTFETGPAIDARSFALKDGREVLLAGIEMPSSPAAKAALEKLLAGGMVILRQSEPNDRYDRLPAQVFVPAEGTERWIQQELLAEGLAQVSARAGPCVRALRAAEAPARLKRIGIWADSAYGVKASDDFTGLAARQSRFTVAEGKVLSVRESGGAIYINFGRIWSRNLTVTILRRNRQAFETAGLDPKKLEGSRLRVRGWVEMRNGPRIDAARPEQIEVAAQD
jgi:Micrococcal nuclease (thermonuclease) homologs